MNKYEKFFIQIAMDLDLTEAEETAIVSSYNAVGAFLIKCNELSSYSPLVFPQGSVRLGTIVKPLKRDDYDIDLVCQLNSNNMSAFTTKKIVGKALFNSRYSNQLEEEHGRCWTLDYTATPPYHIDILPGISLPNERIKATSKNNDGTYKWLYTNPKGFANWFLSLKSNKVSEGFSDSIEKVNLDSRRNILQRSVQLMKRHRDVYFADNPDEGPASVIITALTGLSYDGEQSIEEILINGPIQWISHIGFKNDGLSIKIPSLPDDDYADKWNEDGHIVVDAFLKWHRQLIIDLDNLFRQSSFDDFISISKKMFSVSSIDKLSNSNIGIMNSLMESFNNNYSLVPVSDIHPLFKHALPISSEIKYMPDSHLSVKIICRVYKNMKDAEIFSDNYEKEFYDYSPILKKGKCLAFKAIISRTSQTDKRGYHVKWQITNTGFEAKNSDRGSQLRGEFISETKSTQYIYVHTEETSYSGTHFVQFFVFRYGGDSSNTEWCIHKTKLITINIGKDS